MGPHASGVSEVKDLLFLLCQGRTRSTLWVACRKRLIFDWAIAPEGMPSGDNPPSYRPLKPLTVKSQQADKMSRNFYILAATLGLFAVISMGMALIPSNFQPGLPANASLWRTIALLMLLAGLSAALIGVLSHLFEQVDRRSEESRQENRRKRRRPTE